MKQYLRFKKWVEQKKIQKRLDKFAILWVIFITIILVVLSHRDISSILGLSAEKGTTIILPTPTVTTSTDVPTPTTPIFIQPTLASQIQQQITSNIDCTGPDGKHFQTTRKECDSFNSAWGNNPQQRGSSYSPSVGMSTPEELLAAVNDYRWAHGLSVLNGDSFLCSIAQNRLGDQIRMGKLSHDGFTKYVDDQVEFLGIGEVLAGGGPTPRSGSDIVSGWDNSPTHKERLQDPRYTHGCGVTTSLGNNYHIAVFLFAYR